jgi:cell division protease FtsH
MSQVLGPLAYEKGQQNSFLGDNMMMNPRRNVSDDTAKAIDQEVKDIVEKAHQKALDILKTHRDLLEEIARKILEQEVIEGKELQNLLNQVKSETPTPEASLN